MSTLNHLNSDPNYSVYQNLSRYILSHLDQDSQRAVACAGSGLNQLATLHLAENVKELFYAVIKKLGKNPSSHEHRSDTFLHILSFLSSLDRRIAHCVSRHWNHSLDRLALEEKNAEISEHFEPLRKTVGLLEEHFSLHPNISPERKAFIAATLKDLLPSRKDVKDVADVKKLEYPTQLSMTNLLRSLDEKELAAFLQFSDFSRDNDLAKFLDLIIKCVPLYREGRATGDDIGSLRAILDCRPYFPLNDYSPITQEIQDRAEKEAREGDPVRAVQLATVYSEMLSENYFIRANRLATMSWLLIERGRFVPGMQIATLCVQAVPKHLSWNPIAEKLQGEAEKAAREGNPNQTVWLATLYSEITPKVDYTETKGNHLGTISFLLIERGFFDAGMQIITLGVQAIPNHLLKVRTIEGFYILLAQQGGTEEQLRQVEDFYCKTVIEAEKNEWSLDDCLKIADRCYGYSGSEEALLAVSIRLVNCIRSDNPSIYKMAPLPTSVGPVLFKKMVEALVDKGFFNEAVDIAVICAKTHFGAYWIKANIIRDIGKTLIRKQGASEQVLQIAEICCKMTSEANLQNYPEALCDMILMADDEGNPALGRDIALEPLTLNSWKKSELQALFNILERLAFRHMRNGNFQEALHYFESLRPLADTRKQIESLKDLVEAYPNNPPPEKVYAFLRQELPVLLEQLYGDDRAFEEFYSADVFSLFPLL